MKLNPYHAFFRLTPWGAAGVPGAGTINEITYWNTATSIASLTVATYPSLTELSYIKGVTSAIQTQFSGKANTTLSNLASVAINTTLVSDTDNTDALGTTAIAWSGLFLGNTSVITWNSAPSTADVTLTHSANTLTFAGGTIALGTATATGGLTGNITGNVSGTADTVTNATQAAITSAANLATVGTIGTGVWQGTTIKANYLQQAAADLGDADITVNLTNSNVGNVTNLTIDGTLTAGATIVSDSTTLALANATSTTINFAGAATTLNIGASVTCILNFGGSTTASEFRFLEPSGSGTNYSAFKAVAQAASITYSLPPAVGAAGTYLKDAAGDGVLTWATAGGGTPTTTLSTAFETTGRFVNTLVGTGTFSFNNVGMNIAPGTTSSSSSSTTLALGGGGTGSSNFNSFAGSPIFTVSFRGTNFVEASGVASSFWGIGTVTVDGSGHTYTNNHIGFKLLKTGGVVSVYATQADGTTENASAALTTVTSTMVEYILKVNGTASVDYYWRTSGGALSSATNLTSNLPTADNNQLQWSVSNDATAFNFIVGVSHSSYQR